MIENEGRQEKSLHKRFPKNEIKYLDMSFEEASRFIVSAGTAASK